MHTRYMWHQVPGGCPAADCEGCSFCRQGTRWNTQPHPQDQVSLCAWRILCCPGAGSTAPWAGRFLSWPAVPTAAMAFSAPSLLLCCLFLHIFQLSPHCFGPPVATEGQAAQESGSLLILRVSPHSPKRGCMDQSQAFVSTNIVLCLASFTAFKSYALGQVWAGHPRGSVPALVKVGIVHLWLVGRHLVWRALSNLWPPGAAVPSGAQAIKHTLLYSYPKAAVNWPRPLGLASGSSGCLSICLTVLLLKESHTARTSEHLELPHLISGLFVFK